MSQQSHNHFPNLPLWHIPLAVWRRSLFHVLRAIFSDRNSFAAAGCGFFGTLSLIPTISVLILIYGLAFDPETVEPQLEFLWHFLPGAASNIITAQIRSLVSQSHSSLTFSLILSLIFTLWAASSGTKALLTALNIAYNTEEKRGFFRYQLAAILMTLCAVMGAALTLAVMVALPIIIDLLPEFGIQLFPQQNEILIRFISPLFLIIGVVVGFAILYRYGPSRQGVSWQMVMPGAVLSTFFWWVASSGFSYYVSHIASYNVTYGSLGAVSAVMMWFFVSAYAVLIGAQFNAELESYVCRQK